MANPTLESLKKNLERQDAEVAELMDCLSALDPRDIPASFFDELDDICEPQLAWSSPVTTIIPYGLRA